MKKIITEFIRNAVLSGLFVASIILLINKVSPQVAGLLCGANPWIFICIVVLFYFSTNTHLTNVSKLLEFSWNSFIGSILFDLMMLSFYFTLKHTANIGLGLSAVIVVIFLFTLTFIYFTKK